MSQDFVWPFPPRWLALSANPREFEIMSENTAPLSELVEQYAYELPPEEGPASVVANVPPPMRAFSVARSYFGGQKRPSDGEPSRRGPDSIGESQKHCTGRLATPQTVCSPWVRALLQGSSLRSARPSRRTPWTLWISRCTPFGGSPIAARMG